MKLTVNPDVTDPRFIYYFFRHPETVQKIKKRAITSGVPHINLAILRDFEVPTPSVGIQRRIADKLSAYDDLIENNRGRMALLEESARQLYQEWFVRLRFPGHEHARFADGVPDGWERRQLGDCFSLQRGHDLFEAQRVPGNIPVVSSSGITGYHNEKKADAPGVVTGRYGRLGDVYYIDREYWPHNTALYVIDFKGTSARVVYFFLRDALRQVQSNNAAVPGLNRNVIHKLLLLWPPGRFRDRFDELIKPVFEQLATLRRMNQKLRDARDLLLPRLMSGELAV
jgi:type I restriction enzyme, S subunit